MSLECQGGFIRLCCVYWTKECNLSIEDAELEIGASIFAELVKFKIVKTEGQKIAITFLDDNRNSAIEHSIHSKTGGKKSAEARRQKAEEAATEAQPPLNPPSTEAEPKANHEATKGEPIDRYIDREIDTMMTTSSTATNLSEFETNKKHARTLIDDSLFISTAALNNKVFPQAKMKDYIVTFFEHLIQEDKKHEKFNEFKRHFNSWLRIQTANNIQPIHRYEN
jgi:hypothetical protein